MTTFETPFKCVNGCGRPVDPTASDVAHEVIGFSLPRKQGGQNHVMFRKPTGRYLCPECRMQKQHGHEGQASLW